MNCQELQEALPYIIEDGGSEEEEGHLRECPACAGLAQDLKYIAAQAKLILPMHEPSPQVWTRIEQSLEREGLVRAGRKLRLGNVMVLPQAKSWTPAGWVMAVAATLAFAAVLVNYHPNLPSARLTAQNSTVQPAQLENDDQQVISQVSQQAPDVRRAYEDGLREANAYIADAQQAVDRDPQDAGAQEHLLEAYQQKEMLYQMAAARSVP